MQVTQYNYVLIRNISYLYTPEACKKGRTEGKNVRKGERRRKKARHSGKESKNKKEREMKSEARMRKEKRGIGSREGEDEGEEVRMEVKRRREGGGSFLIDEGKGKERYGSVRGVQRCLT